MVKEKKPKGPPKKRGRKPKGGKIVNNIIKTVDNESDAKSNIILHLRHLSDFNNIKNSDPEYLNLNNIQNNTIINDDMFTKFFKNKPTKWYNRSLKHKSKILNPCPHCNTYGAKTYVPELPETERGIQYSSKKNDKTIFILIIIAMIVFFLTLVN